MWRVNVVVAPAPAPALTLASAFRVVADFSARRRLARAARRSDVPLGADPGRPLRRSPLHLTAFTFTAVAITHAPGRNFVVVVFPRSATTQQRRGRRRRAPRGDHIRVVLPPENSQRARQRLRLETPLLRLPASLGEVPRETFEFTTPH